MVRNRVIFFPRQIIVCLSLSLIIALFSLSCQKDDGIKPKDPSALTTAQAKEYFEQTAQTLKFLTTGITPAGTKNADYSLTENMVIEWNRAIEGEDSDSYLVEVPIRMSSPVTARLFDGVGHLNKNIRQVPVIISLLIERHKDDGCLHHSIVTTVGTFSKSVENPNYGFLCDKSSFSGYQFFSSEEGVLIATNRFNQGMAESRNLLTEGQFLKVDSLGKDIHFHGISFATSHGVKTKGGGGASSGEDNKCPNCNTTMQLVYSNYIICYWCPGCKEYFNSFIDPEDICFSCGNLLINCLCCPDCHQYPCQCLIPSSGCSQCGSFNCNGSSCQTGQHGGEGEPDYTYRITTVVMPSSQFGYINKTPSGEYIEGGIGVHMSAIAYPGYHFVEWKKDNVFYSSNSSISFIANGDHCYSALFAED